LPAGASTPPPSAGEASFAAPAASSFSRIEKTKRSTRAAVFCSIDRRSGARRVEMVSKKRRWRYAVLSERSR